MPNLQRITIPVDFSSHCPHTDEEMAVFFDRLADEQQMVDFPPEERGKLDAFLELWAIQPGFRVLEPGCGSGRLTEVLAPLVGLEGELLACDLSDKMLQLARARNLPPQARVVRESVFRLGRPDASFDRVICLNVFPHFHDPYLALREFARMLKPGGELWINHFEGRESLNHFHSGAGAEVSDHALPCAHTMKSLTTAAGLRLDTLEDCPERYVVKAVRP